MMKDRKIGEVYKTDNLKQFKHLASNRELRNRDQRVKNSIKENGWIDQPILVNEKMEVIDGQARLEACKELGIGITYTIIRGLTIRECRILNSVNSNWSILDRIKSYADSGNQNYQYLYQIVRRLEDKIGHRKSNGVYRQIFGESSAEKMISKGKAIMTEEMYNKACIAIDYVAQFMSYIIAADLDTSAMAEAMMFVAYRIPDDKKQSLLKSFENRCSKELFPTRPTSFDHALKIIEEIYNYKKPTNSKLYFVHMAETEGKYKKV